MIDLENLLRKARPDVPDLPDEFNSTVMQRIAKLDVPTEPVPIRDPFSGIQLGIGLLALIIATLLFNYNTYEILMNGSLELLFFGRQYILDFIRYLPWDLIVSSLLLTLLSAWLLRRSGMIKRGIASLALISYLVTGVGGSALAAAGFNDQIEAALSETKESWSWLKILRHSRARQFIHHPHMKLGKVEKLTNGEAEIITPNGASLRIQMPPGTDVEVGQYVRASGIDIQSTFSAEKVHICNPSRVNRYFGQMKHHHHRHHQMMKSCCGKEMGMH